MSSFFSAKKYGHERGFSAAFRQWRADSHCKFMHGYSFEFEFVFGAKELDENNWVVDFGCFKRNGIKDWFKHMFDHTTIVAKDDPYLKHFEELHNSDLIQLRILDDVGCEKFAEYVFKYLNKKIKEETDDRVKVHKVQCWEHGENMAEYYE